MEWPWSICVHDTRQGTYVEYPEEIWIGSHSDTYAGFVRNHADTFMRMFRETTYRPTTDWIRRFPDEDQRHLERDYNEEMRHYNRMIAAAHANNPEEFCEETDWLCRQPFFHVHATAAADKCENLVFHWGGTELKQIRRFRAKGRVEI